MEQRTPSHFGARDRLALAVLGVVLLASAVAFVWGDRAHDWRWYQYEFRQRVAAAAGKDRVEAIPSGLQQIWVAELGRADRCVTCHQATSWKGFETADEPFRTHRADLLKTHPVERFGCTSCHGGQGWAVDVQAAHGPVEFWEEPVLGQTLGEGYSLAGNKGALVQMSCNRCHRYDRETKGADAINLAKRLVIEKGCRACHVINGRGGSIGPDLTTVGDKAPEQYDYGRLNGHKTAFAWHVAHLKEPKALVPDTVMPMFGFSTEQAQAIAMLVSSWKKPNVPASYLPGVPRSDPQTPTERAEEERMKTGPGAWFVKTGCFVCHNISSLGVKSPAQIGPDLSIAVEDVRSRFGRELEDFLREPTGTMAVVLSRQIILTPEQKQVAVQKLHEAYAEHQKQKKLAAQASAAPGHR